MSWLAIALTLSLELVRIPGGLFLMGSDQQADEAPRRRVRLSSFYIDRDEVTRAEYARCVAAGHCTAAQNAAPTAATARLPVTGIGWFDAASYCRFVGKRLPTEAEWERAARGTDGRIYPWGNEPDCARANFGNYEGEGRCSGNPGRPEPVGSRGGTLHDMAGNVWEWVADWYSPTYYHHAPAKDPKGPARGERRVVRGGACCSMFGLPRASNRLAFPPSYRDNDIGFRCASDSSAPRQAAAAANGSAASGAAAVATNGAAASEAAAAVANRSAPREAAANGSTASGAAAAGHATPEWAGSSFTAGSSRQAAPKSAPEVALPAPTAGSSSPAAPRSDRGAPAR